MSKSHQQSIEHLYHNNQFIPADSVTLEHELKKILYTIDMNEFFRDCELDSSLRYKQAVTKACRKATMYILYAVTQKNNAGRNLLDSLQVCDGLVGNTPHTWLVYRDLYYVDMTLTQFTPLEIPKIAILPISLAKDIYTIKNTFTWRDWTNIEANMTS